MSNKITTLNAANIPSVQVPPAERTRRSIAYWVVIPYVLLLALTVIMPLLIYISSEARSSFSFEDIKPLTETLTAAISGIIGVLGFVLGYYFKSQEGGAVSGDQSK